MDFFRQQERARQQTWWLLLAFAFAIAIVVLALDAVVLWVLRSHGTLHSSHVLHAVPAHRPVTFATSLLILATILGASAKKWFSLGEGGAAIARALGGKRVSRSETDPAHQRLMNVVEEMAIAAQIPPPQVYVIAGQPGINAFAAGHSVYDAAITVTSGALSALNRDELQAVIAHEFSHVLNGDMRLNLRLVALLYGLFFVTLVGRWLAWSSSSRRLTRGACLGLPILAVGSIGLLAGRLLQSAVSRQREQLADASAVQFTRNPEGLKQALVKIASHPSGSAVEAPQALEVAHLFFADGEPSLWWKLAGLPTRLLATHPPIVERIRALDPSFDPRSLTRRPQPEPKRAALRGSEYPRPVKRAVENPVTRRFGAQK